MYNFLTTCIAWNRFGQANVRMWGFLLLALHSEKGLKGFKKPSFNLTQWGVTVTHWQVIIFPALKGKKCHSFQPPLVWVALAKVSKCFSEFLDALWMNCQFNSGWQDVFLLLTDSFSFLQVIFCTINDYCSTYYFYRLFLKSIQVQCQVLQHLSRALGGWLRKRHINIVQFTHVLHIILYVLYIFFCVCLWWEVKIEASGDLWWFWFDIGLISTISVKLKHWDMAWKQDKKCVSQHTFIFTRNIKSYMCMHVE